jgi:transposase
VHTAQDNVRRDWRIPDEVWARIVPLRPPRTPHPLGCHRPRGDDRRALDASFFVLRTGCQGNALHHTRRCASRAAQRRVPAWAAAGVCVPLWQGGLAASDAFQGIAWAWRARDGAMTTAPLGGETGRHAPSRSRAAGDHAPPAHRRRRRA